MTTKRIERAAEMRERRHAAVLEAAIAEACEKGFDGVRQAAVARRAGIGKGGVINAFGNMAALKSAVMQEAIARFIPTIVAAGLATNHPVARSAPLALREAAAAAIS
jgi:AcrR family transcriptional regulator